ncbi:MAG: 23S rRNA (uracil(1939)-C(5))-methyltransferase RlmD [Desulfuromonas sp.]|nr:MAG: 23S rRNA (uracil(1939)-C(5))-methyltransferase RlmD [Desulfuromonas sp.]
MNQDKRQKKQRPAGKPLPKLTLSIDRLDGDGLGVARHAGKNALVWNGLPGEKVDVAVEHEGRQRLICATRRVLEPSPERQPPICRYFDSCRGCTLGSMSYPAQLDWKQKQVRDALHAYPSLQEVVVPPVWGAQQPTGYRTSAKLVFAVSRGKLMLGLYRRGTHRVVDIHDCPLHHPLINRVIAVVRDEVERQNISVYNPRTGRGLLRYLLVRVSPTYEKALVTLVTTERDYRHCTHLAKWLKKKLPEVIGVHQNVNASSGNVIIGREFIKLIGARDLRDRVGDVTLHLAPGAFFQVNQQQAERIYHQVTEWAAPLKDRWALDVYCGIGGIALNLAPRSAEVIGIESAPEAVASATANARTNKLENCRFLSGDAAERLHQLALELEPGGVAVVNPPRSGCADEVLATLARLRPTRLVYVSCNPETLARDLVILQEHGYRIDSVQPVDMFPQTGHIETIVRLLANTQKQR